MIFVFHQTASKTRIEFTLEMFAFHNGCLPIKMGLINSYSDYFTNQYYKQFYLKHICITSEQSKYEAQ